MKTLYLARHAKSSWANPKLTDFERPLNNRGKRDAPLMGKVLKDKKEKIGLIISSPAKRTKKTAVTIAEKLGYPQKKILFNEELYEASTNALIKVLKKIDQKYDSVMIFGHNPGLTLLNNYISDHYIDNIPTCGVVALQLDEEWSKLDKNTCKFLFFEYPKMYVK